MDRSIWNFHIPPPPIPAFELFKTGLFKFLLHKANIMAIYSQTGNVLQMWIWKIDFTFHLVHITLLIIYSERSWCLKVSQEPIVWRLFFANPGLNFCLGFFFFCSKAFPWIIFAILFSVSNHQIVEKKNNN